MNRREAKIRALEIAHWRVHDASISWQDPPNDRGAYTDEEHTMLSKELDAISQRLFERAENMKEGKKK